MAQVPDRSDSRIQQNLKYDGGIRDNHLRLRSSRGICRGETLYCTVYAPPLVAVAPLNHRAIERARDAIMATLSPSGLVRHIGLVEEICD